MTVERECESDLMEVRRKKVKWGLGETEKEAEEERTMPASSPSTRRSPAPGRRPSGGGLMDHILR